MNDTYLKHCQKNLFGRYITLEDILPNIQELSSSYLVNIVGHSEEKQPIYQLEIGSGEKKVLMWSQMHGNESTTTKALMDFLFYLKSDEAKWWCSEFSFCVLPMLNPDGARNYTRVNANGVDLNRDAFHTTQIESKILREVYEKYTPDFAFNLHDQRTIFSAGQNKKPATLSFLAPAFDEQRMVNEDRKLIMQLIATISNGLKSVLAEQIGRYDDAFNINCVGDYFMNRGTPTILFEAGHYAHDYYREKTRFFVFEALCLALGGLASGDYHNYTVEDYLNIPQNEKKFVDILIRSTSTEDTSMPFSLSLQYLEKLSNGRIKFIPVISNELTDNSYGHIEIKTNQKIYPSLEENLLNLKSMGLYLQEDGVWDVNNLLMK